MSPGGEQLSEKLYSAPGMTLRDWFAGQAMAGACYCSESILSAIASGAKIGGMTVNEFVTRGAYEIADAMIAEKRRTETAQCSTPSPS